MNQKADTKQLRVFGLLVGGIFGILGLWPLIFRSEAPRVWGLALAGLLIIPGLAFPRILAPVYRFWMALGHVLGWVNTRLILGVIFFGLITPMSLTMRLFGKDSMRRNFERTAETYRVTRSSRPGFHMRHQF